MHGQQNIKNYFYLFNSRNPEQVKAEVSSYELKY